MSLPQDMSPTQPDALRELGTFPFALCALLVPVVGLCAVLWAHWTGNPDLSHGLLMPLVFLFLIHEARASGTLRFTQPSLPRFLASLLLSVLSLLLCAGGSLYAAAMGWGHPLSAGLVGAGVATFLLLALLNLSDHTLRLIPLNWASACAALLWLLVLPMPPGAYARLSGALQLLVSKAVLLALNLLGVAATRHGNIIELAAGRVGVEEACSGMRSLIACIFAATLISALLLKPWWKRALLILSALPLALLMNLLRSLLLTLLANQGVNIVGAWHDFTGFAVLALTATLLFFFAQKLSSKAAQKHAQHSTLTSSSSSSASSASSAAAAALSAVRPPSPPSLPPLSLAKPRTNYSLRCLQGTGALLAALCLLLCFLTLRPRPALATPPPTLDTAIPAVLSGWSQVTANDLQRFAPILGTDHLLERTYHRKSDPRGLQVTIYAASWLPGTATPAQIALHTPEVCWPGQGWTQLEQPRLPALPLPAGAQLLLFKGPQGQNQQVAYWHLYDGLPVDRLDPYKPLHLLQLALAYGFKAPASQCFLRISGNRPWAELKDQEPVKQALHSFGISDLSSSAQ